METDLRQEDALSPTLFNIVLELVVKEVLDEATSLIIAEGRQIKLAAYADDIIIIGENEEGVIHTVETLINKWIDIGLEVNEQKTKHLMQKKNFDE